MELHDLKKYFWMLVIFLAGFWYVNTHYTFMDAVKFAKEKPNPEWSPKIEYYAGMGMFIKENYGGASEAFTQLLTDYPTCQYAERALFRLGVAQIELQQYAEARVTYERYLEEFPKGKDRSAVEQKYEFIKFR